MRFSATYHSGLCCAVLGTMLAVLAIGCGPAAERNQVVPVTGRVFLGEEPLQFGQVVFQPVSGGQPASGTISDDGKFVLSTYAQGDGAALGKHRVRIVSYSSQDPKTKQQDGPQGDSLGELLTPQKYSSFASSGLEVSVLEGGNAPFVFKLEAPAEEASDEVENLEADAEATEDTEPLEESSEEDAVAEEVAQDPPAAENEQAPLE